MPPLDWMDARAASAASAADDDGADALLDGLNPPQRDAVTHGDGPLLILAGAGSGKTRVITRRIAWLVSSGRAAAHEILAITFTNKAAREMRERVEAVLPASGAWVGTFHATCARILRRDIEALGSWTRDFSIYDTHDRNVLLKRLIKDAGYDAQRFRPGLVGGWISEAKRETFEPGVDANAPGDGGMEDEVFRVVSKRYDEALRAANALDFDDLLVRTLELFEQHPGVRNGYAQRFRHVLVDEYQDTNRVQYLLTRHFAGTHGNLTVCGDPDQSIYAWRGADIRNILDFETDFGGRGVKVVKLEQNYRSSGNILAAAQALIAHNEGRKDKGLWTEREPGERLLVMQCGDENDEANEIAVRIRSQIARGDAANTIAVFYRVNFMQRALERALRLTGVPYQIVGGVEFYQRREVRDLVSYLALIVNPRDDVAFRRVVNVPARGVGDTSLARLGAFAAARGVPLTEAVRSDEALGELRGRAKKGVLALRGLLDELAPLTDAQSAAEALERVLLQTDFFAWLARLDDTEAEAREENVEELRAHAATYDRDNPEGGLRGFLQDVALVSDVDGFSSEEPRVALMTMHAAKGLEFPTVFLAGCEEDLLPHALALMDDEGGEEEERRLFYVALTRAEQRVVLTHAATRLHYGETSWRRPSRFLDELPGSAVDGLEADAAGDEKDALGAFAPPDDLEGVDELREGATVVFREHGSKVLLVQYAHLRVLER